MDHKEFFYAVVQMRERQKGYFKRRTSHDLATSKASERIVDAEIKRVLDQLGSNTNPQTKLNFDE